MNPAFTLKLSDDRLYFVTTSRNLLSIVAGGAIYPASMEYRYYPDSRAHYGGSSRLWKKEIPGYLQESPDGDPSTPVVVVEIDLQVISLLNDDSSTREMPDAYITDAPIPISYINAYIFSEQAAIDDFLLRLFEEVPIDRTLIHLAHNLPWNNELRPGTDEPLTTGEQLQQDSINLTDRAAGALMALYKLSPANRTAINFALANHIMLADIAAGLSFPNMHLSANKMQIEPVKTETEHWLLATMLELLKRMHPEGGFTPVELIGEIRQLATSCKKEIQENIFIWCDRATKLLDGEVEAPVLSDEKNIIQRAVLLFILRPEIKRIEAAASSSLKPGLSVYLWAVILSGFYTGATRLNGSFKKDYRTYAAMMGHLLNDIAQVKSGKSISVPVLQVHTLKDQPGTEVALVLGNETIWTRSIPAHPILQQIYYRAKSLGVQPVLSPEADSLICKYEITDGQSQDVRISINGRNLDGADVIRFEALCQKITSKRQLTTEKLLDLLSRNLSKGMQCYFAYDRRRNEVSLISNQIIKTMDDDEFLSHMREAATASWKYRQESRTSEEYKRGQPEKSPQSGIMEIKNT